MVFQQSTIKSYLSRSFVLLACLVIGLHMTSCGCKNQKGGHLPKKDKQVEEEKVIDPEVVWSQLRYDPSSQSIICQIQNKGKNILKGIQIQYQNVSKDKKEQQVVVDNKKKGNIYLDDLAGGSSTGEHVLQLDYKTATQATFKFEVLYEGKPLAAVTKEVNFSAQTPQIKLIPQSPTVLQGSKRKVTYKLEEAAHGIPVNLHKLSIVFSKAADSKASILYKGVAVTQLSGVELGDINQDIDLNIRPGGDREASFTLQLLYAGIAIDNSQTLTWQANADLQEATKELFEAISHDEVETAKQLLEENPAIPINSKDEYGYSPLHRAADKMNVAMIEVLLANGGDINILDRYRNTPLLSVAFNQDAANESAILLLLEKGAKIDATTIHGDTPLHKAAFSGNKAAILALLNHGADIHAIDNSGDTPLYDAIWNGNEAAILTLLDHGARVKVINKDGDTPLHRAAIKPNSIPVTILLDHGADINATNNKRNTPLHIAVKRGNVEVVRLLLNRGAIPDIKNKKGETPADLAAKSTNVEIKNCFIPAS
jgi:ankyrin repeat protein